MWTHSLPSLSTEERGLIEETEPGKTKKQIGKAFKSLKKKFSDSMLQILGSGGQDTCTFMECCATMQVFSTGSW